MRLIAIVFTCLLLQNTYAQSTKIENAIVGVWKIERGLHIKIYLKDSKYYGDIVSLNGFNNGQKLDEHNPDKSKKGEQLVGKTIISHLEYDSKNAIWKKGKMYAPHMGITANLEIESVENNTIVAVGSKFFFWHTEHWIKVD